MVHTELMHVAVSVMLSLTMMLSLSSSHSAHSSR